MKRKFSLEQQAMHQQVKVWKETGKKRYCFQCFSPLLYSHWYQEMYLCNKQQRLTVRPLDKVDAVIPSQNKPNNPGDDFDDDGDQG